MKAKKKESARAKLPDQESRDAAVMEKKRNVLIDAGAGTGKTTILVKRFVEMLAPTDGSEGIPIERMAAVTFTRRAAGELKIRIRGEILAGIASGGTDEKKSRSLRIALEGIDTACIGTIHGFADRLLRLKPIEAGLGPSLEIEDDVDYLVRQAYDALLHGAEAGTLKQTLAGTEVAPLAAEAERTILDALEAGIPAESWDAGYSIRHGLRGLFDGFITHRDVPPAHPAEPVFDRKAFTRYAKEFVTLVDAIPSSAESDGTKWLRNGADKLRDMLDEKDPLVVFRETTFALGGSPPVPKKGEGFGDDEDAWKAWMSFDGDPRVKKVREKPLRNDLFEPLHSWMGSRLVRTFPVVVEVFEQIKAKRGVVDQIDLLLKLRNMLRDDPEIRNEFRGLFDHVFVDEFQDTDPLQAEIAVYLCSKPEKKTKEPVNWQDLTIAPGKLTIVGDPKQSIYRFRRADIRMYAEVREMILKGGKAECLRVDLETNMRSRESLIRFFNDRFERIMAGVEGQFDPETGRVAHRGLEANVTDDGKPSVRALGIVPQAGKAAADDLRATEAEALARYLRRLVEVEKPEIRDPITGAARPVGYGDIAVLAKVTSNLPMLFSELDRMGVPHSARGGKLFLEDPVHKQFILGLRAIADKDDGVAMAALMRPPFFAIDLADLAHEKAVRAREQAGEKVDASEAVERARAAMKLIHELRSDRFDHSPGTVARDLLERTAFARHVALSPNGAQRLSLLREICFLLDQKSSDGGLDYDASTSVLREWVTDPPKMDPPAPVGSRAVQVTTIYQAKGLEFPVVILWDCRAGMRAMNTGGAWAISRDGSEWSIGIDRLGYDPKGIGAKEQILLDAELERILYVAATRARDLLVVTKGMGGRRGAYFNERLLDGDMTLVETLDPYEAGKGAKWAAGIKGVSPRKVREAASLERKVTAGWEAAAASSARPRFRPSGIAAKGHELQPVAAPCAGEIPKASAGRFGKEFGEVVHIAIGMALRNASLAPREAVSRAAKRVGLDEYLGDAEADVRRALEALEREGILPAPPGKGDPKARPVMRIEYPVAGTTEDGNLLSGFIDLVYASDDRLDVIDFKTDTPPSGPLESSYPGYVDQVRTYARLLKDAGLVGRRRLHIGLLFTSIGTLTLL